MNPVAVLLFAWLAFHAGQLTICWAKRGKDAEIDRLWDRILAAEPALDARDLAVHLAHQAHTHSERRNPARLP